jgi:hypothetical protein
MLGIFGQLAAWVNVASPISGAWIESTSDIPNHMAPWPLDSSLRNRVLAATARGGPDSATRGTTRSPLDTT